MRTKPHQGFETLVPSDLKAISAKGRAQCTANGTRHVFTEADRQDGALKRELRRARELALAYYRSLLGLLLLLTAGCASHQPIVVVVPPIVVPDLVKKPKTYYLPLNAENWDRICAVTFYPIDQPCWTVGYLRGLMISKKAEIRVKF